MVFNFVEPLHRRKEYVRAKREDDEEMNAIAHASDVLKKAAWQRTPRELAKLQSYMCGFVSFMKALNPMQQRQLCKVATAGVVKVEPV